MRLEPGEVDFVDVRAGGDAAGVVLKRVKEQVRAVPGDGLGFGLLRYLNPATRPALAALPTPQIGFNYLGRFTTGSGRQEWQPVALGGDMDERMPAAHILEAGGVVRDGADGPELSLMFSWPGELLAESVVRELGEGWVAMLTGLAAHAARPGAGGHSPSDFPLVLLDQGQVAELEAAQPGLAEVWPLSPLQEGLLFHAMLGEQALDAYSGQGLLNLLGPLDTAVLRAAGQALLDRHPNLRAGFRHLAGLEQPVQVIADRVALPWREADVSALPSAEAEAEADRLAAAELARAFDPAVPPLLRFLVIRFGARHHRLVITNHHILMDGWSLPVLLRELSTIYAAGGDPIGLPPVTPYGEYLAWLGRQDRHAAREAWQRELAGTTEPTLVAPGDPARLPVAPGRVMASAGPELIAALRALAREHDLTLNTVVQGAWAMLVSRLAGQRDVVFGAVVAGRPPELPGVEDMLGLFVNTVPVRVPLDPNRPVIEMLTALQDRQSALIAHQYLGLAEIQRLAGAGATFDTLVAYENYPFDPDAGPEPGSGPDDTLRITPAGGRDSTHYPLTLAVIPGATDLRLRLTYRPDVFEPDQVEGFGRWLVRILEAVAADPGVLVGRVPVLGAAEWVRVVEEWNDTGVGVGVGTLPGV
ncbi:condensation domain-containing protein, partial [Frankia sp. BMG5.23]|uniref:condensation domain-containing protein n=1 Tax=Frankia sp. BMG5.23 TaxID=683305 RepID=UPI001F18572C